MLRSRRLVLISCAFLLMVPDAFRAAATSPPNASLPSNKEDWLQIETAHFRIYSNAPERRALELGRSLERFRAVLGAFQTNLRLDTPQPNFIYIFKNQESFNAYNLRVGGKLAEVSGLFHPGWDANYIIMSAAWNLDPRPTIYHEFTHQFVRSNLAVVPAWFNEGLAEYFSTFVGDDRRASLGKPVPEHVQWLSYNAFIPLEKLFNQEYDPDFYTEVTRAGTFYAESWALVHYLLANGAERQSQTGKFLDAIGQGLSPEEALQTSFHTSLYGLQKECQAYVAHGRFNYSEITFTDKFRVDDSAKVRPMGRSESLARLGELLQHLQEERLPDAEAHLREALRLDPEGGIPLMNMGTLLAAKGEFDKAVSLFERAAASLPDEPLLTYREARALLHRKEGERPVGEEAVGSIAPETIERARGLLKRTIKIRPSFAEAYIELGNLADASGGSLEEGIEALAKARTLMPSRLDVTMNLFFLNLKAGNRAAAQELFDKAIIPQRDEESIRWARMRLEYDAKVRAAGKAEPAIPEGPGTTVPVPDEALFQERKRSYVQVLEEALKTTSDPESRKRLEQEIERARASVFFPGQIDAFNKAVERANARDYPGALTILEKLLPQVQDEELRSRVEALLADLKKRVTK
jgi:tetratricopeptide (TPR) repeat protein